jgi:hypothetical protein
MTKTYWPTRYWVDAAIGTAPTLAIVDNADGTATATITGGDAGAVNTVYTQRIDPYFSANAWTVAGSRAGNGSVTLTLDGGLYVVVVQTDGAATSPVVALRMAADASTPAYSPADVVRHLLIDMGLGSLPPTPPAAASPWPIYATQEPDTPDATITLYNTVGTSDGCDQNSGEFLGKAGIQVRVRATAPVTGYAKAEAIRSAMATQVLRETVAVGDASYFVHAIDNISDVFDIGREPRTGRFIFTINAVVSLRVL